MPEPDEAPNELDERKLRMKLMDTEIQQRLQQIEHANKHYALEVRKFVVQAILAAAALVGAGVALGRFIWFHQ